MSRVKIYSLEVPILNQSFVPCLVLTVAFWTAYKFLRRQVRWSGIPISLRIFYSLLWSTQSRRLCFSGILLLFLWFNGCWHIDLWFLYLSKSSLYIWKFSVHVLPKPSLEDLEHYIASMWDENNCAVVWHSLALPFFGNGMKTDLFQSCNHCWFFQICWHIECSTLTASSFRIWTTSAEILSPPLVCSE